MPWEPMPWVRVFESQMRPTVPAIACLILGLLLGSARPREVRAQSAVPTGIARAGPVTPEQRAELYRELEQHAQVLEAQSAVVKTAARLIGPTVVYIEVEKGRRVQNRRQQVEEEAGSGVIIRFKGKHYVLTTRHVIQNSPLRAIKINLADRRRIHPTKVWEDADTDIAVMGISAPELVAAPVGDSDKMEIGDFVLAVGSPFGLSNSVTYGIVSAKGRRKLQLGGARIRFQDFIQTDASINPGNSGGPLINLRGEVIGINSAIASNSGRNEGIGFAIPINVFMTVARQLIEKGKVSRAFLGVKPDSSFGPAMAAEFGLPRPVGARIGEVIPNTPAERAKLQVDDVILQFNNVPVEDADHLINLVGLTEVGKVVRLVIFRDRKPITIEVEVGNRSKLEPDS